MAGIVTLYPISYKLEDLQGVSRDEIAFHLVLSRISNEIAILKTQTMLTSSGSLGDDPKAAVSSAAAVLNLQMLTGRLFEAWEFLRSEQSSKIYKGIIGDLSSETKAIRKNIGAYFGRANNLVALLRNKVSFHMDSRSTYEAIAALEPDTEIVEYLSEHRGSVYYGGGWILAVKQLQVVMGEPDLHKALTRFHDEVTNIAALLLDFIEGVNSSFLQRHLKLSKTVFDKVKMEVHDCPDMRTATIPFFLDARGVVEEVGESG